MGGAAVTGPLLERGEELARIESALGDARFGRGRFVVVEGPAGIGKTALLAAARATAGANGMRVLRSREPALVEASDAQRADLLQSAAGVAAGLLGLPGAVTRRRPLVRDPPRALLVVREPRRGRRATGARPRRVVLTGLDLLTASERRIAELASQDLTNRQIAQLLFITDRTVEGHLTSVFRKLRLDSRTELAAALV
jgi:DNA-binding CsgD family transcriptional regulator